MKTATLIRQHGDKETKGQLTVDTFSCDTLELPWLNNQNDISCIPEGNYLCKYNRSEHLSDLTGHDVFTYELQNVPMRTGIRIHSASFAFKEDGHPDLSGCIALGNGYADLNGDGVDDLINSRVTIAAFETYMNKEDFMLVISWQNTTEA